MSIEDERYEMQYADEPDDDQYESARSRLRNKVVNNIFNLNPKKYCWTDLVSWAYRTTDVGMPQSLKGPCDEPGQNEVCYCGQWRAGKFLADRTREQKRTDDVADRLLYGDPYHDELPF